MTSGVYKITNTVTGKCYIGSSVRIKHRFGNHKYYLNNNAHHAKHMQNSWNKYGEKAFIFEIVFECAPIKDIILFYEQLWIDFYGFENLYNHNPTAGSPLGTKQSDEIIKKRQKTMHNNRKTIYQIDMTGKIIAEYKGAGDASSKTGFSEANIRNSLNKFHKCGKTMYVRNIDDIQNAILKNSVKMKNQITKCIARQSKGVAQFDKNTLNEINRFYNSILAKQFTGISRSHICECANGKRLSAGGYIWRYVDDKEI